MSTGDKFDQAIEFLRKVDNLKGSEADPLHGVLCAAGYNIRGLLRMIVKKGLSLLLCLLQVSGLVGLFEKLAAIFGCNRLQGSNQRWVLA